MDEERTLWTGRWRNERGSELRLELADDGGDEASHLPVRGFYRSAVGRVAAETEFPLSGWVAGRRICFTVSFRDRSGSAPVDSLAAWCGHLEESADGSTELVTLWHLSRAPGEDDAERRRGWGEVLAGASRFAKLPDAR